MSSTAIWEPGERAGLGERISGGYRERLLRVFLDPNNESAGAFDLFYFLHEPQGRGAGIKTVLFCAGGPRGNSPAC